MNAAAVQTATASATDAELVDAVRAGDEQAFEELYRRYCPRLYAFVRRRVRDDGRAEDVTQDAFLSALRRLRETDTHVSFRPWIYEIARNATIDLFRRNSRAHEVSVDDPMQPSDHLRLLSPYGPDREVAAKQDLETLRGAFDELSDRHERILVMRELEGLSYREIGERMQLTRPGVESTLFRARRRLQTEFAELETGRRCLTVRGAMGRLVEGMEVRSDRGLVKRHVRRCAVCRATAHELGLVPERASRAARVAALLPLPFVPGAFGAKAAAVVAAVALAGSGVGVGALTAGPDREPPRSADLPSVVQPESPTPRRTSRQPAPVRTASAPVPSVEVAEAASARLTLPPRHPHAPPTPPAPARTPASVAPPSPVTKAVAPLEVEAPDATERTASSPPSPGEVIPPGATALPEAIPPAAPPASAPVPPAPALPLPS